MGKRATSLQSPNKNIRFLLLLSGGGLISFPKPTRGSYAVVRGISYILGIGSGLPKKKKPQIQTDRINCVENLKHVGKQCVVVAAVPRSSRVRCVVMLRWTKPFGVDVLSEELHSYRNTARHRSGKAVEQRRKAPRISLSVTCLNSCINRTN